MLALENTPMSDVIRALASGRVTATALTKGYLARIEAYDRDGFSQTSEFFRTNLVPFDGVGFTNHPRGGRLGFRRHGRRCGQLPGERLRHPG